MDTLNKVLIVDDSEPLQQIYKVTLRRYKCPIITASDKDDKIRDAIALGQGHLYKPFTSNEVHALIEKLFPLSKPDGKTAP